MDQNSNRRAHPWTAGLAVWLVPAAALIAGTSEGESRIVAVTALLGAALAGQLFAGAWQVLAAGVVAGAITFVALWQVSIDPLAVVLTAMGVAATSLVSDRCRRTNRTPTVESNSQMITDTTDPRLPAGVTDERLLERLAVHEMTRARRYEHPLTLLLVDVDGWSDMVAKRGRRGASETLAGLAVRIRRLLRDVDAIGLHGDGRLAILLPETPLDGALIVADRITEAAREDLDLRARVGAALFPEDAVSVDGLIHEAVAALDLTRLEGVQVAQRVLMR